MNTTPGIMSSLSAKGARNNADRRNRKKWTDVCKAYDIKGRRVQRLSVNEPCHSSRKDNMGIRIQRKKTLLDKNLSFEQLQDEAEATYK